MKESEKHKINILNILYKKYIFFISNFLRFFWIYFSSIVQKLPITLTTAANI